MDDVAINKAAIIERCYRRVQEEYEGNEHHIHQDLRRQDSIILNIQRACEAAIDLAMHLVRKQRLGVPQQSRDAFDLLIQAKVIEEELGNQLKRMVGFRNIAVHDYQRLNLDIVQAIADRELQSLLDFAKIGIAAAQLP